MKFKQIYIFYSDVQKKTGIQFFKKKFLHKFLNKLLCDVKLITSLIIF